MRLEDWKTVQMQEIVKWADSLDEILTPSGVTPKNRHDYPKCLAICDKLKRVCQMKHNEFKDKVQKIEDKIMEAIEEDKILFKMNKGGMPEYKKKYSSVAQRERESRLRLNTHPEWSKLCKERDEWLLMSQDWITHHNKLRREADLIENDFLHNGGQKLELSKKVEALDD